MGNDAAAQAGVDALTRDFAEDPELAGMLCKLGNISWQQEKYDWSRQLYQRARQLYQRTVETYPDSNDVIVMKSRVEKIRADIKLGDDANVPADVNELIANFNNQPGLPVAVFQIGEEYYNRAYGKYKQGRQSESDDHFRQAIAVWERVISEVPEPNSTTMAHAYYFSALCYRRLGEYPEAIEYFKETVSRWPNYQFAWNAQFLIARGFEQLVRDGQIPPSDAGVMIRYACEQVITKYPDCAAVKAAGNMLKRWKSVN